MKNRKAAIWAIIILTLVFILALSFVPRVPQDPGYNDFADKRNFLGIKNGLDVLSNLAFIFVGTLGLKLLRTFRNPEKPAGLTDKREIWIYMALYSGMVLTGLGSAYYHMSPNNGTLVWDRLPMAFFFCSFLCSVISERISIKAGLILLVPFVVIGMGTVIYWGITERSGMGDLRPYGFVHFYPALAIFVIMYFFPSRYSRGGDIFIVFAFYALATVSEAMDKPIFDLLGLVSGHTIKHLLAAAAIYWHVRMVAKRKLIGPESG